MSGALAAAYAHVAIRNEIGDVLDARSGTRNTTLNAAAFALGQLIATGALNETQVAQALEIAARHIGLDDKEAIATIHSGLAAGQTHQAQCGWLKPGQEGKAVAMVTSEAPAG